MQEDDYRPSALAKIAAFTAATQPKLIKTKRPCVLNLTNNIG